MFDEISSCIYLLLWLLLLELSISYCISVLAISIEVMHCSTNLSSSSSSSEDEDKDKDKSISILDQKYVNFHARVSVRLISVSGNELEAPNGWSFKKRTQNPDNSLTVLWLFFDCSPVVLETQFSLPELLNLEVLFLDRDSLMHTKIALFFF